MAQGQTSDLISKMSMHFSRCWHDISQRAFVSQAEQSKLSKNLPQKLEFKFWSSAKENKNSQCLFKPRTGSGIGKQIPLFNMELKGWFSYQHFLRVFTQSNAISSLHLLFVHKCVGLWSAETGTEVHIVPYCGQEAKVSWVPIWTGPSSCGEHNNIVFTITKTYVPKVERSNQSKYSAFYSFAGLPFCFLTPHGDKTTQHDSWYKNGLCSR